VPQFFGCGGGTSNGYVCEPTLDREMTRASRLASHSVGQAASQWAAIDRRISNEALWVPTVNEREIDVVSSRVHNYEYHPIWGFLADQSWLE
jgi:ABC-type transport system substrate-binding protein